MVPDDRPSTTSNSKAKVFSKHIQFHISEKKKEKKGSKITFNKPTDLSSKTSHKPIAQLSRTP